MTDEVQILSPSNIFRTVCRAPDETDNEFRARILASLDKPMKCTECNDTRVYLGLGTAPPEPCRACQPQSAAASTSFYPVGHVSVSSGSRNEFRSQAKMSSFRPLWYGFEFGRSVIPADVGGPVNMIPSSDTDTPKLSVSSLSDGQYLVRKGSGIGGADFSHVPTTDLRSFAGWVKAALEPYPQPCQYAKVVTLCYGSDLTVAQLYVDQLNINGQILVEQLTRMAQKGAFQEADFERTAGERWVHVCLKWTNLVEPDVTVPGVVECRVPKVR